MSATSETPGWIIGATLSAGAIGIAVEVADKIWPVYDTLEQHGLLGAVVSIMATLVVISLADAAATGRL